MRKCYACGGIMENGVESITSKGKTIPQQVMKCNKCGKAIVSSNEYERVRKELYPSIIARIKNLFKVDTKGIDVSKGRVL